jgi:exosortase
MATVQQIAAEKPAPSAPATVALSAPVWCNGLLIAAALAWAYAEPIAALATRWSREADYSHCFLVPVFAAYLLWHRRGMIQGRRCTGRAYGLVLVVCAAAMRWYSAYYFFPLLDPLSLIPCLVGVALIAGGWPALKWSWPAIAFLLFMIPLPGVLSDRFSHPLQRVATIASTWLLQLFGVPAISRGNIIRLTTEEIGVVEACSGLRMLMLFCAITVGASFLIKRPLWEKLFVGASALAIGVVTNIIRITVTALLYENFDNAELAELVFHDLAGWLMMPIATLLLGVELFLLSKLLMADEKHGPIHLAR